MANYKDFLGDFTKKAEQPAVQYDGQVLFRPDAILAALAKASGIQVMVNPEGIECKDKTVRYRLAEVTYRELMA